jgi:hypothetical protein
MQQARSRFSTEQIIFVGAALVLIIGIQLPVAHYLSPKSGLGYAIGIVGGSLILAQLLYAVRKRVRSLRWLGSVPGWFQTHMMMGIIGPVCILIHCGFSLGATNSNIALFSMLTVAGSGIFGRYFYSKIHHGLYGRKASLSELQERASELQERSTKLLMMPELAKLVEDEEQRILAVADWHPGHADVCPRGHRHALFERSVAAAPLCPSRDSRHRRASQSSRQTERSIRACRIRLRREEDEGHTGGS